MDIKSTLAFADRRTRETLLQLFLDELAGTCNVLHSYGRRPRSRMRRWKVKIETVSRYLCAPEWNAGEWACIADAISELRRKFFGTAVQAHLDQTFASVPFSSVTPKEG